MVSPNSGCERCGGGRDGGNVPWCSSCLAALRADDADIRREYRRDYARLRARQVYSAVRPKWIVLHEGRTFEVTLRRRDGRVMVCGGFQAMDAGRRLVFDVLGCRKDGATLTTSGGGRGRRAQARFRLVAEAGGVEKLDRVLLALTS